MPPARANYAVHVSREASTESAFREARRVLKAQMPGGRAHLLAVFASGHHDADNVAAISAEITSLRKDLGHPTLFGCIGESVIGGGEEVERQAGLTVWCASLPGERIEAVRMRFGQVSEDAYAFTGWPDALPPESEKPTILLVADPFSFPVDELLKQINLRTPWVPIVGGMASGGSERGESRLFLDDAVHEDGAVGVVLSGPFEVRTVVSQGCRPIGEPYVVTKSEDNVIQELGGKPALAQLTEMIGTLPPDEKRLVRRSLHVGRVISENRERFAHGDFLVRNVMGVDQDAGSIAISDYVRRGMTIQFHVRDAASADSDLKRLLARERGEIRPSGAGGALLFSCNGRGRNLFPEPNHDVGAVQGELGSIPVGGFFAAGEIGPVGGKNFLPGFTASVALFCDRAAAAAGAEE